MSIDDASLDCEQFSRLIRPRTVCQRLSWPARACIRIHLEPHRALRSRVSFKLIDLSGHYAGAPENIEIGDRLTLRRPCDNILPYNSQEATWKTLFGFKGQPSKSTFVKKMHTTGRLCTTLSFRTIPRFMTSYRCTPTLRGSLE